MNDWTEGRPGLAYEACTACGRRWYFGRGFCPHCGSRAVEKRASNCRGVVHAITIVERAPSPEWRAHAPYGIALIDIEEGVRVMTHAEPGLAIGDLVRVEFQTIADRLLPVAVLTTASEKTDT